MSLKKEGGAKRETIRREGEGVSRRLANAVGENEGRVKAEEDGGGEG